MKGPHGAKARQFALDEANDDQKLYDFAISVQRSGETVWLIDLIERDLAAPAAWTIARAMVLAGFLAPGEASEALWQGKLAAAPAAGWLAKVWKAAHAHFEKGRRHRYLRERYLGAPTDVEAFEAFEQIGRANV